MELILTPELQSKVDRIAAENQSAVGDYLSELVERYVDHDAWFRQSVREGLAQLDRDEFSSHDDVRTRIDKLFQR